MTGDHGDVPGAVIDEGAAAGIVEDIDDDRELALAIAAALHHAVVIVARHHVALREEVHREVVFQDPNAVM